MLPVVVIQILLCPEAALFRTHYAGGHVLFVFKTGEGRVPEEFVQRPEHLHVGVHIHAALIIKGIQAHHVGYKGELALGISFGRIGEKIKVEVIFIPLLYLVFRKVFFPGGDALLCQRRHLSPSKPAVVDDFGYHIKQS